MRGMTVKLQHYLPLLQQVWPGVVLALSCLFLYHSQLQGSWRFDDPHHLSFLQRFEHLDYFYKLDAARLQSGVHFTPFNILSYDLALKLFGQLNPYYFYLFHLSLISIAGLILFYYLRMRFADAIATTGALIFLGGFPIAGMSGQLMVGHYIFGAIFFFAQLVTYEKSRSSQRYLYLSACFYFLACLSKEIFVPAILFVLIDHRVSLRQRCIKILPYLLAFLIFLILRTVVIGELIGGYQSGIGTSLTQKIGMVMSGLTSYFLLDQYSAAMSLGFVCLIVFGLVRSWQLFGLRHTILISLSIFAAVLTPLIAVASQVGPQAPGEIRLIFFAWIVLCIITSHTLHQIGTVFGSRVSNLAAIAILSLVVVNTHHFMATNPLTEINQRFDVTAKFLAGKQTCHLIDQDGWSSWGADLRLALHRPQPLYLFAPSAVINAEAKPGDAICHIDHGQIKVVGDQLHTVPCKVNSEFGVSINSEKNHIHFAFEPGGLRNYIVEVEHSNSRYFLQLPQIFSGAFPDKTRFERFRVWGIDHNNTPTCSGWLSYLPRIQSSYTWKSSANTVN